MFVVPQSSLLNYALSITKQLKWTFDYLLYNSFFHHSYTAILLPEYLGHLNVRSYGNDSDADECAVCLCKIEQGDQVRELRCHHLFHRVCLDRWLGCGHVTCPLCRNNLGRPPPPLSTEVHQEVIMINFCGHASRSAWWLR